MLEGSKRYCPWVAIETGLVGGRDYAVFQCKSCHQETASFDGVPVLSPKCTEGYNNAHTTHNRNDRPEANG